MNRTMEEEGCSVSKEVEVAVCMAMALFYVAVVHSPALILPSITSSFSSSLHDSTVSVRHHFHRRLSRRLRSNPSYKENGVFTVISSLRYLSRSYCWINGFKVFVIVSNLLAWRNYVVAPLTEELSGQSSCPVSCSCFLQPYGITCFFFSKKRSMKMKLFPISRNSIRVPKAVLDFLGSKVELSSSVSHFPSLCNSSASTALSLASPYPQIISRLDQFD
ncbi:hypothetical protein SDJN03_20690, partial [Cucurbita argyrosperma subsp. sororia]